jgi:hypothetical protein
MITLPIAGQVVLVTIAIVLGIAILTCLLIVGLERVYWKRRNGRNRK